MFVLVRDKSIQTKLQINMTKFQSEIDGYKRINEREFFM